MIDKYKLPFVSYQTTHHVYIENFHPLRVPLWVEYNPSSVCFWSSKQMFIHFPAPLTHSTLHKRLLCLACILHMRQITTTSPNEPYAPRASIIAYIQANAPPQSQKLPSTSVVSWTYMMCVGCDRCNRYRRCTFDWTHFSCACCWAIRQVRVVSLLSELWTEFIDSVKTKSLYQWIARACVLPVFSRKRLRIDFKIKDNSRIPCQLEHSLQVLCVQFGLH